METLNQLGGFLLRTIMQFGTMISLFVLEVHIIYDIASLYELWPVILIPVEMLYGLLLMSSIVRIKAPTSKEMTELTQDNDSEATKFKRSLAKMGILSILYLMLWFFAIVVHYIAF